MAFFSRFKSRKIKKRAKNSDPILSAATHSFIANRVTDLYGITLGSIGAFLIASLYSFNPEDPSLNTASASNEISNIMGGSGAYVSDLMLQTLGMAAYLIAFAFVIWGYRVLSRKDFNNILIKITLLSIATLTASIIFARIPSHESWEIGAYLGGSAGGMLFTLFGNLLQKIIGASAFTFIVYIAGAVTFITYLPSLGISMEGWKEAAYKLKEIAASIISSVFSALIDFKIWHEKHSSTRYTLDRSSLRLRLTDDEDYEDSEEETDEDDDDDETEDEEESKSVIKKNKKAKKPIVAKLNTKKDSSKRKPIKQKELQFSDGEDDIELPDLDLLDEYTSNDSNSPDEDALHKNAELLQSTLSDFGIKGDILKISPGPVITLYEMEPAPGTKTSRVINLADDIARSMSTTSVRVSVVPGRNAIGLELPNAKRETVFLKEILASEAYERNNYKLPLALGKNIAGEIVITDLTRMPHLLVAGTTGSGKSVAVNAMILSLVYKLTPEQCRFIMIDPKMLELSVYEGIPHLLTPVVTEPHQAISALKWAVREMEDRYRAMSKLGVRNIESFNERIRQTREKGEVLMHKVQTGFDPETGKPIYEEQPIDQRELPFIVVVVDEFADLMLVAGKEVEKAIQRLAQMARAAGIHLIMATQRPSVDVVTGIIKSNFPTRISFQVTSKIDSRTIISDGGAEQLLGRGDMLYMVPGGKLKRIHGPFVSDDEIERVVKYLRTQGEPEYIDGVTDDESGDDSLFGEGSSSAKEGYDELYDQAVALVIREGKVSTSFIQRYLQIGYNRAARIVECMERDGLISPANSMGRREILVNRDNG